MTNYAFRCRLEDYVDYNFYLAVHDQSMQKRLILFIVGFWATIALVKIVYFPDMQALYIALGIGLVYMLILPKVYWYIVLKRITNETKKIKPYFPEIRLTIDKNITLNEDNKTISIEFADILNIGWTKNNCYIFYTNNGKKSVVIVPLRDIGDLEQFASNLSKGVQQ